jgi:hypothetical protein
MIELSLSFDEQRPSSEAGSAQQIKQVRIITVYTKIYHHIP